MSASEPTEAPRNGRQPLPRIAVGLLVSSLMLTPVAAAGRDARVCIRVWKEAPYRSYGYDHIVAVHNGCGQLLRCGVTTSANSRSYGVSVAADRVARVLTFRGAPRKDFTAHVRCRPAE